MVDTPPKEVKPIPTFMFHDDCPEGQVFMSDEVKALEKDGWYDSPKHIKIPAKKDEVSADVAAKFTLEDHKGLLEKAGFICMTPEQLKSQANKMAAGLDNIRADHLGIEDLSDDAIRDEVSRRGLNFSPRHTSQEDLAAENEANDNPLEVLEIQFNEDPESLTKEELITLGNGRYDLGLKRTMKEATLISKINDALKG